MYTSIQNSKGLYWQVGEWVSALRNATKYSTEEEAHLVMALAPRKFRCCKTVKNALLFKAEQLPAMPAWEYPIREEANWPNGVSIGLYNEAA